MINGRTRLSARMLSDEGEWRIDGDDELVRKKEEKCD